MRKIIPVILAVLIYGCNTQKDIIGNYCSSFNGGFDSSCYYFKENQTFEYETVGDLGTYIKGSGKYEVGNKKIKLVFNSEPTIPKTQISKVDIPEKSKDSINLRFVIKDETGNKQYGAMVLLASQDYKNKNYYSPDEDLIINKERSDQFEKIKIINVFYEPFTFTQKLNKSQEIEIIQIPEQPHIVSDTIRYLDFKKQNSKIVLESGNIEFSKS
ncbi:hypothetical protein G3I01_15910 [Gramella sp. MT6]|uniref:hypothetical protein n=1 Tax=Gramella sp. MT6 TaxID=2705471 RepID=UPI001C5EA59B|nr:hypothetical protein [Gramella sp. MT6]QYA26917.1 hypothetical protein G3I01_15910 [Gramella sp. MT6]